MQIGPFTFGRTALLQVQTKAALPLLQPLSGRGGWWSVVREPFMGAWQRNQEVNLDTVMTHSAVFACITLIAPDMGKMACRLVEEVEEDIWIKAQSPAFSPFFRKPNRYQTMTKYIEQYITSKLVHGNAYVLKQRDNRGVVTNGYVLDPTRVKPLVAQDGAVFYELRRDDLSGLPLEAITVPAREIIHDTMVAPYHPLVGVSPIYACGLASMQGLSIQENSNQLFRNGAMPGGILTAPGVIPDDAAARLAAQWKLNFTGENAGNVAVVGNGLEYKPLSYNAVDMQLIDQLKWTGETVCSCFHVPPYMIGIGPPPPYANMEPLIQQYYNQCLQSLIKNFEDHHDVGLELPPPYGTELDINDLIWMDTATKTEASSKSSDVLSPNERRKIYFGVGPVEGGETPYMQQQQYSLAALAKRDRDDPFSKPEPAPPAVSEDDDGDEMDRAASFALALETKFTEAGLYA